MKPLISVVMPNYNTAAYLAEAVESIRAQTYDHWELLIVDDGSTDASLAIARDLTARDERIRCLEIPHQGIVAALNTGVHAAQGELIARMDADDVALPHRFQVQLDELNAHPDWALVGGGFETIDVDGQAWKTQLPPTDPGQVRAALARGNCLCHSTILMRRAALETCAGPYRAPFMLAEDYDLWLRMAERHELANVPAVVLRYRRDLARLPPDRVAVQTISTLAARFAAEARRRGEPDPATDWVASDRDTLLRAGVPAATIAAAVRRQLLAEARLAKKRGFPQSAAALLRKAGDYAPRGEGWQVRLDYLWRSWRAQWA
jgi:glycosyltransferase involved in cell wall biosynthesis